MCVGHTVYPASTDGHVGLLLISAAVTVGVQMALGGPASGPRGVYVEVGFQGPRAVPAAAARPWLPLVGAPRSACCARGCDRAGPVRVRA